MNNTNKNICNPKIFKEVFDLYAEDIKRFLYFKYGDLQMAEDIMQDTFVRNSTNESPEFLLEEKEFLTKIEIVITSLTEKQRETFLLSRMENKKYREIAELLSISVKAVEKRMHNALLIIRKEIGNI